MRAWKRSSPLSNMEHYRERVLTAAIEKVRSERTKNIRRLRNGDNDFNGLAREILYTTMHDKSVSHQELLISPTLPSSSSIYKCENHFDEGSEASLYSCPKYEISTGMECQYPSECADHHVIDAGDDELLQLLMDQVASELQLEYYSDTNSNQLSQFECDQEEENCDLSNLEEEADDERFVICPVCRVSSMELMRNSGSCRCGTVINLRNERTGEILTAQQLRNKLEDIYQRHKLVCEYDVNISPLPLEYPENKNIPIIKFKNIEGFHFENSEISEKFITEYLNSMDSYDINYENNKKKESDINLKLDRNVQSLREERVLTFIQREPFHLTAVCSFCGFDEQIL